MHTVDQEPSWQPLVPRISFSAWPPCPAVPCRLVSPEPDANFALPGRPPLLQVRAGREGGAGGPGCPHRTGPGCAAETSNMIIAKL